MGAKNVSMCGVDAGMKGGAGFVILLLNFSGFQEGELGDKKVTISAVVLMATA